MEINAGHTNIDTLFAVGAHYGYAKSRRHPSYAPFVFATKDGSDVIDLEKTVGKFAAALAYVKEQAAQGKTMLFVGTKPEIKKIVEAAALSVDAPYMTHRWIGGLITNFMEVKKRIKRLDDFRTKKERGELSVYTKKEQMLINQEIDELTANFGGVAALTALPGIMFVVDPRHEETAMAEAAKKHIPVVVLAGTDCNIADLEHVIPANDSGPESVELFVRAIADAYSTGRAARASAADAAKAAAPAPVVA